ncbi:MAG: sigma-70 family RNA polymerase sigma factor [Candidatus Caldarchaeum sp.]
MVIKDWTQAQQVAVQLHSADCDEWEPLWDALIRWLQHQIPLVIARIIPQDRGSREDAVQEALLNIYQGIHTYDGQRSFRTWVEHVAIHAAYRVLRRRRTIQAWEQSEPSQESLSDEEPRSLEACLVDPVDHAVQLIHREWATCLLECARSALSEEELLVFETIVSKDATYEDLSAILGKRTDALRQQFTRAREKTLAQAVLHSKLFTHREIKEAVDACQQSSNPLTQREMAAVQETLNGHPHRKPPSHRNIQHFRNACTKLAPFLLRYLAPYCSWFFTKF